MSSKKYKNKYRIDSARLKNWDYRLSGAYFITICTADREHFFGDIENGEMKLSNLGVIADIFWHEIPARKPNAKLGEYVIMPNHMHGILILDQSTNMVNDPGDYYSINDGDVYGDEWDNENGTIDGGLLDGNFNDDFLSDHGLNDGDLTDNDVILGNDVSFVSFVETLHATFLQMKPTFLQMKQTSIRMKPTSPTDSPGKTSPNDTNQRTPPPQTINEPDEKNEYMSQKSPKSNSVSTIIRSYKSAVTKHANRLGIKNGWQPRFHDHIIRNSGEYQRISNYIINNPQKWENDKFHKK